MQTALCLMGINPKVIMKDKGYNGKAVFWDRPDEYLWNILELAYRRYNYEIRSVHPDLNGSDRRSAQLNAAWDLIKKSFAKRGFVLPDRPFRE